VEQQVKQDNEHHGTIMDMVVQREVRVEVEQVEG
jgi:hypothetical protein